jgi:hypothetical protein
VIYGREREIKRREKIKASMLHTFDDLTCLVRSRRAGAGAAEGSDDPLLSL